MCIGGGSAPAPPPPPVLPPPPPTIADPAIKAARDANRQNAALAQGRQNDILTTAQGLDTSATTQKKVLLGS